MFKIKLRTIWTQFNQVLLVIAAFALMTLASFLYDSRTVRDQMYTISAQTMETMQTAVSANLNASGLLFSDVVRTTEGMVAQGKSQIELLKYLTDIQEYYAETTEVLPDFMKIYGYIRGEFLDGSGWIPPVTYDATKRPWYIGAELNAGQVFFSEPYIDADTGETCISFSRSVFGENRQSYGILAIDLNLSRITHYISNQQIANNGYGLFISDSFTFVTHKFSDLIKKKMSESGDYLMLYNKLVAGEEISAVRFKDTDGTRSIAFFRTLFNGWYIGIITPEASYMKPVRELAIVLSVIGAALAILLSILLVRNRVRMLKSVEESHSKSTFLARMSHEMRTPMNAIIGMTEIARNNPGKTEYCLDKISNASNHLLGVINDVLDMSKIEAGKLELSPTDFILADIIEQVKTVVTFKIEEKKQSFTVSVGQDVPKAIIADKQRLAQIITNLLSNATKFTQEGGNIQLIVSATYEKDICKLRFEVIDNGIGISEEQKSKMFRSFEQADSSISRKYGGTGLGLAISKRIVDLMGGDISLDSELGKGSNFAFAIPVMIGEAVSVESDRKETKSAEDGELNGLKILLAEDIELNREILITLLDGTGIEIDVAENGQEACAMFEKEPYRYDMIFMDIHMPVMDGLAATMRIRALNTPRAKDIPIIAMTASVFKEDIDSCHAAGMNDHTGKPIDLNDVTNKILKYSKR